MSFLYILCSKQYIFLLFFSPFLFYIFLSSLSLFPAPSFFCLLPFSFSISYPSISTSITHFLHFFLSLLFSLPLFFQPISLPPFLFLTLPFYPISPFSPIPLSLSLTLSFTFVHLFFCTPPLCLSPSLYFFYRINS